MPPHTPPGPQGTIPTGSTASGLSVSLPGDFLSMGTCLLLGRAVQEHQGLQPGVVKDGSQCRDTPASDSLQGTAGSSSEDLGAEDHSPHRTLPRQPPLLSFPSLPPLLPGIPPK